MSTEAYDMPLPARWGPVQRAKNTVIYWAVRAFARAVKAVPMGLSWHVASLLGWLAYFVDVGDRRRALTHLAQAFPEKPERERKRIAHQMFVHLARSAVEAVHVQRLLADPDTLQLTAEHRSVLDEALALGKGVIVVSGHIGNWELLGQVVARAGYDLTSVAKPLYDPRLTRLVHDERTRFGMQLVWRSKSAAGAKDILRVFKRNGIFALLIDQDTRVQGVFVPFFGKPAHTPSAPAALALRAGAAVVVSVIHRKGRRHEVRHERLKFEPSGERDQDIRDLTAQITARLEAAIREHPEQWVWMHRRWKTRPEAQM